MKINDLYLVNIVVIFINTINIIVFCIIITKLPWCNGLRAGQVLQRFVFEIPTRRREIIFFSWIYFYGNLYLV